MEKDNTTMQKVRVTVFLTDKDRGTLEDMALAFQTNLGGLLTAFCSDLADSIFSDSLEAKRCASEWYKVCCKDEEERCK